MIQQKLFSKIAICAILLGSIISLSSVGSAYTSNSLLRADVGVVSRYAYNVYYDYLRAISDELFAVKPELKVHSRQSSFYVDGELAGLYEKYFTQTIQDHFDYDGLAHLNINELEPHSWLVSGKYHSFSDPSPNETYGRLTHNQIQGEVKFKTEKNRNGGFDASLKYFSEDFTNPALGTQSSLISSNYLANRTIEGSLQYSKLFSTETIWFLRASGGTTQYPNSIISTAIPATLLSGATQKNNSTFGLAEAGMQGRLSEKSTVDFSVGYLYRGYTDNEKFMNSVFNVHFTDQLGRRDQLLTGFNYTVKDSYWTDYYLEQEVYVGSAHVVGDQLIMLSRIAFDYRNYSSPNRRFDERIVAAVGVKYSLTNSIKLTADLKLDLLSSDAFNTSQTSSTTTNPNGSALKFVDAPASYQAGSAGIGIVADF
jgi:hypothetical protein